MKKNRTLLNKSSQTGHYFMLRKNQNRVQAEGHLQRHYSSQGGTRSGNNNTFLQEKSFRAVKVTKQPYLSNTPIESNFPLKILVLHAFIIYIYKICSDKTENITPLLRVAEYSRLFFHHYVS